MLKSSLVPGCEVPYCIYILFVKVCRFSTFYNPHISIVKYRFEITFDLIMCQLVYRSLLGVAMFYFQVFYAAKLMH